MFKKIKKVICVLLCVVMCGAVLTGCNIFTHNNEKDMKQVVATIGLIEDGAFKAEKKEIYKIDLVNAVQSQGQGMLEQYPNATLEEVTKAILDNIISTELINIEAERRVALGLMEWGMTENNRVTKLVYETIDNQLQTLRNNILADTDNPIFEPTKEEAKEPTYPVKKEVKEDEDEEIKDTETYVPDKVLWPMTSLNVEKVSLDKQAMNNLLSIFEERTAEDFRATKEDKEKFKQDKERIDKIISEQGIEKVYPMLFGFDETGLNYTGLYSVNYLVGKLARQQVLMEKLEKSIISPIEINDEEVKKEFDSVKKGQLDKFKNSADAYKTAVAAKDPVLYHPNDKYLYVKHILIPFSEKQAAQLKKDKVKLTTSAYEAKRAQMVNEIVAYPHKDGEDDKQNPTTVANIFKEVQAVMTPLAANAKEAERAFDDLIYKYNTDPGIFDNEKGYAIPKYLDKGEEDTMMKEFADAARDFKNKENPYAIGSVLDYYAVTDYGVHIMYFASDITSKTVSMGGYSIKDPVSPGEYNTYFDLYEKQILEKRKTTEFNSWKDKQIIYYQDNKEVVKKFENTYKDIYKA